LEGQKEDWLARNLVDTKAVGLGCKQKHQWKSQEEFSFLFNSYKKNKNFKNKYLGITLCGDKV
jgi:hypothetical protein